MGNRIIKESICTSNSIDGLSWFEEVFFYRLIVNCDDYGRYDARPAILKSRLFPLKDITNKQIEVALSKLATAGMVRVYEYDRQAYLQLENWGKHQIVRNQKSKFPSPDENSGNCIKLKSIEINCSPNPIQSESNSNPESNPNPIGAGASYCRENLMSMSAGNYEDLRDLMTNGMTDELVIYAVDEANAQGKRTWAYVRSILNRWVCDGIRTLGDAKAAAVKRKPITAASAAGSLYENQID